MNELIRSRNVGSPSDISGPVFINLSLSQRNVLATVKVDIYSCLYFLMALIIGTIVCLFKALL